MLEMPGLQVFKKEKKYSEKIELYYADNGFKPMVQKATRNIILKELESNLSKERFYTVTDLRSGEIILSHGTGKWLGLADKEFSQKKFEQIIHPAHAVIQCVYASCIFELLSASIIQPAYLQPSFICTLALKIANREYLYCKRETFPFQLTDTGKIISYLSEFTVIKKFSGEIYHNRISASDELYALHNQSLYALAKKFFKINSGFTIQEQRILKRYAYTENSSSGKIAKSFKIAKVTVDKYNQRILRKSEKLFHIYFDTASAAAAYFRNTQLI